MYVCMCVYVHIYSLYISRTLQEEAQLHNTQVVYRLSPFEAGLAPTYCLGGKVTIGHNLFMASI